MKGLADTAARLAGVVRARPLVTAPAPTYRPNRAARRRGAKRQAEAHAARPRVQPSGRQLAQAERNGCRAGQRGKDHAVPGTCPYTDPALVDAWAVGYVVGKREQTDTEENPA